ncbi:MAG: DNA repair protein RecO [Fusobacteriota bacterium]
MKISKIKGLVIKKVDYKDADRLLIVFSPTFGKQTLSIKGIRKSKKREKIAADILTISEFVIYENKWKTISDIQLINSFDNIRGSLNKILYGSYILKLIDLVLMEEEEREDLYKLTIRVLKYINKIDTEVKILYTIFNFLLEIIKQEGLEIKKTTKTSEKNFYFGLEYGKIEYREIKKAIKMNKGVFNIFDTVLRKKTQKLFKEKIDKQDIFRSIEILENYLQYQLDIKIKLKDLLGRI